jgi:hypothetical protein
MSRIKYNLIVEMNLAAVLPSVRQTEEAINTSMALFGFSEKMHIRGQPITLDLTSDRVLTSAEIQVVEKTVEATFREHFPGSLPEVTSIRLEAA